MAGTLGKPDLLVVTIFTFFFPLGYPLDSDYQKPTMQINREAIEEFKKIYEEEFGETISDAEALEMGQRLISLFEIIYRPLPHDPTEPPKRDAGTDY